MLEFVEKFSYLGLFLILLIEESGIPIPVPGDLFIATASTLPGSSYFNIILIVFVATLFGSTLLFTVAKKVGHSFLLKFGKHIKITPKKIKKIEAWFEQYGGWAIVIGRLIPGLRIVTPAVAGLFNLSYRTFWLYSAIAAFIWANIYFLIGRFLGNVLRSVI